RLCAPSLCALFRPYAFMCLLDFSAPLLRLHSFPTRRSSDLVCGVRSCERRSGPRVRTHTPSVDVLLPGIPPNPRSGFLSRRMVRDRKSTRLNSSHVSISYAVFCLKKKNRYDKNTKHVQQ